MKNVIWLANWWSLLNILREDGWPVGYFAVCCRGDEIVVLQFKPVVRSNPIFKTADWSLVLSKTRFLSSKLPLFNQFYNTCNIAFRQCWTVFLWLLFSITWTWRQIALCCLHTWSQCLLRARFPTKLWFRWHARACSVFHSNSARDWTRWPWRPVTEFTVNWWERNFIIHQLINRWVDQTTDQRIIL